MMKIYVSVIAAMSCLAVNGCAGWQAPSAQTLSELSVIEFGDKVPTDKDFILHFAADKPIPTAVAIQGNLFSQEAQDRLDVKLRRDIYVYHDWMSFDRVNWIDARKALGVKVEIKLPGYTYPQPGHVHIRMDLKPN